MLWHFIDTFVLLSPTIVNPQPIGPGKARDYISRFYASLRMARITH